MGFFFVKRLASGRRIEYRSESTSWTTWLQDVPRRKRAILGFSTAFDSRFSKTRLERAVRGFLGHGEHTSA